MAYKDIKRICLWSGPRNISTALMYSFAQRKDIKVFDEPLYAHFLANTNADEYHPGAQEVLSEMEQDGNKVIKMMMNESSKPVLFFKHMTHHLLDLDRSFMKGCINVILTRNPEEMLSSYAKVISHPTMADVGYAQHIELLEDLNRLNVEPIVLDSKKVLLEPRKTLSTLCEKAGIDFDDNMLQWQAGARPEDGSWAKYWYGTVHRSTHFGKYTKSTDKLPKHLETLLAECMPHYNELMKLSI